MGSKTYSKSNTDKYINMSYLMIKMPKNNKPELKKGEMFSRLTIISYSHSDKRWRKFYNVRCECGNKKIIMGSAMTSGNTKSCGCLANELKKKKRISETHSETTAIILGYKRHAKRRGFEWILSREDVEELIEKNCIYCGSKPSNIKKTKNSLGKGLYYSGIDRIDSKKDYTKRNCVPCCKICNYAKNNMSLKDFKNWAIKIGKQAMAEQWGTVGNFTQGATPPFNKELEVSALPTPKESQKAIPSLNPDIMRSFADAHKLR